MELMRICGLCFGKDYNSKIHFVFIAASFSFFFHFFSLLFIMISVSLLVCFWSGKRLSAYVCGQKFLYGGLGQVYFKSGALNLSLSHKWSFFNCLYVYIHTN